MIVSGKSTFIRSSTGQMGIALLLGAFLAVLIVAAVAVDAVRINEARQQLHRATDSAALAGAIDLFPAPENCYRHAMQTAEFNNCHGKPVSNKSPGTNVKVDVELPKEEFLGRVTVTASMEITHIAMPVIGAWRDTINSKSVAGPLGYVTQVPENLCFPLAVSWDGVPKKEGKDYPPLQSLSIGDSYKMFVGSQQVKNSAFTSFLEPAASAHYINKAVEMSLGMIQPEPHFIPSVKVGDAIELNNGIVGQKQLASSPYRERLLNADYIVLPIITGQSPFNQSRQIIGFVGLKITNIEINTKKGEVESLTGTIVRVAINAPGADPNAGTKSVSILAVKLLQ